MTDVITTSPNPTPTVMQPVAAQTPVPLVPTNSNSQTPSPKQFFTKNHLLILLIAVAGLLGLILLFVSNINPKPKTATLPPDVLLATVGDQKIYRSTVEAAAKEQYVASAVDASILERFYTLLVEQAILNYDAKKLGISVSENDITKKMQDSGFKGTQLTSGSFRKSIRYDILKQIVLSKQLRSVTAYTIGFYIAPYDYEQKPEYALQRSEGSLALSEAELKLRNGDTPFAVAEYLYNKYVSLHKILAVNGNIFNPSKVSDSYTSPKLFSLKPQPVGLNYYDPDLFSALSHIQPNEVVKIDRNNKDGSGGDVIKGVSVNKEGYLTYKEYLDAKKNMLVKVYNRL